MDRRDDQLTFIAPQQKNADLVVRFQAPPGYFLPGTSVDHDDAHLDVRIDLHERLPRLDLDDVLAAGANVPVPAIRLRARPREHRVGRRSLHDRSRSMGRSRRRLAHDLDERIWAHMETHRHLRPSEIGDYLDGTTPRHSEPLALTQLIVAYQVARAGIERGDPLEAPHAHGEPVIASGHR